MKSGRLATESSVQLGSNSCTAQFRSGSMICSTCAFRPAATGTRNSSQGCGNFKAVSSRVRLQRDRIARGRSPAIPLVLWLDDAARGARSVVPGGAMWRGRSSSRFDIVVPRAPKRGLAEAQRSQPELRRRFERSTGAPFSWANVEQSRCPCAPVGNARRSVNRRSVGRGLFHGSRKDYAHEEHCAARSLGVRSSNPSDSRDGPFCAS